MTFLGLAGMIDPPGPEAKAAIAVCADAGIRPVMIDENSGRIGWVSGHELRVLQAAQMEGIGKLGP